MAVEKLVLTFPPPLVKEPIVTRLVREHNLDVNIMSASISPDEQGHMVIELVGEPADIENAKIYFDGLGVMHEPLIRDVRWIEERCVHCTACITVCPTEALQIDRDTMKISFDQDKCIACGLCIPVCGYNAMEIALK